MTTYAWAFLGLIVTVGALNYLGILEPSSYTPERCSSGAQISCDDTYLAAAEESQEATLLLLFNNNYPRSIVIENVTLTNVGEEEEVGMEVSSTPVDPGWTFTAPFSFSEELTPGRHIPIHFTIEYRREGGSTSYNISGSSVINVQEAPETPEPYCGDGHIDTEKNEECDPPKQSTLQCGGNECLSDCTCV